MGRFGEPEEDRLGSNAWFNKKKRQEEERQAHEKSLSPSQICEEIGHDFEAVHIRSDEDEPGSGFYRCKRCNHVMD